MTLKEIKKKIDVLADKGNGDTRVIATDGGRSGFREVSDICYRSGDIEIELEGTDGKDTDKGKFRLITANVNELEDKVNEAMDDGWMLYGYPFTFSGRIYQAVVKEEFAFAPGWGKSAV